MQYSLHWRQLVESACQGDLSVAFQLRCARQFISSQIKLPMWSFRRIIFSNLIAVLQWKVRHRRSCYCKKRREGCFCRRKFCQRMLGDDGKDWSGIMKYFRRAVVLLHPPLQGFQSFPSERARNLLDHAAQQILWGEFPASLLCSSPRRDVQSLRWYEWCFQMPPSVFHETSGRNLPWWAYFNITKNDLSL